jgi:uncharacterized protein
VRTEPFLLLVSDLLGRTGVHRDETVVGPVTIEMDLERVDHPVSTEVRLEALAGEILARGTIAYEADLQCNRCLAAWSESAEVSFAQLFAEEPDEETRPITHDGYIDLEPVVRDEVSLPLVPLCREDCRGLCPTCGTDLNTGSCPGHADESDSPFGALGQLLEP